MDAVFFLQHSKADDIEIRYALRAIARYAPWINKVWVFGDRPEFLTSQSRLAQHLPHESIAWIGPYQTPVRNFFLMFYLIALTPEIDNEILWFCDDFILLRPLTSDSAQTIRYLEDLHLLKSRGKGLWKDSLWRTYDVLRRFQYPTLNYEVHAPTYFRKRWILDAVRDFRDFITEDRWYGLLGPTGILNHARRHHQFPVVSLREENSRIGFHGKAPSLSEVREATKGRAFLGFDDEAFGEGLKTFLAERFAAPCVYEERNMLAK